MTESRDHFDLAGMTDDEGRFLGHLTEDIDIYVPPNNLVSLDSSDDEVLANIIFPVPTKWVIDNRTGNPDELKQFGWEKKVKKNNLLDDFVILAEASPKRYLSFAKKWGPYWFQINPFDIDFNKYNYRFAPWVEHIAFLRTLAREVKVILEIASSLKQNKLAKNHLWKTLAPDINEANYQTIDQQKMFLTDYINIKGERIIFDSTLECYPTYYFLRLRVDWSNENPELYIATRIGFYSAMWLQLLQAVTANYVYVCNDCSRVYVRNRKAAEGRKNFCKACRGETNKGSKKLSARGRRKS